MEGSTGRQVGEGEQAFEPLDQILDPMIMSDRRQSRYACQIQIGCPSRDVLRIETDYMR